MATQNKFPPSTQDGGAQGCTSSRGLFAVLLYALSFPLHTVRVSTTILPPWTQAAAAPSLWFCCRRRALCTAVAASHDFAPIDPHDGGAHRCTSSSGIFAAAVRPPFSRHPRQGCVWLNSHRKYYVICCCPRLYYDRGA